MDRFKERRQQAQRLVAKDAGVDMEAARAGGMMELGGRRLDDAARPRAARQNLVVTTVGEVAIAALRERRPSSEAQHEGAEWKPNGD